MCVCVYVGEGPCVCEEKSMKRKKRKTKNRGMLGFVNAAEKSAESREMRLREFLFRWGKSYCDRGQAMFVICVFKPQNIF